MPLINKIKIAEEAEKVRESKKLSLRKELQTLDKADEIGLYYGFQPVDTPTIPKNDPNLAKLVKEIEPIHRENFDPENLNCLSCLEEKVAIIQKYVDENLGTFSQPIMIYYHGPILQKGEKRKATKEKNYGFEIVGTEKSIAEATLIKTAVAILNEEGFQNLFVEINSIGDKDSNARWSRELTNYYRKHLNLLPAECKQALKKDPLEVFACTHEKCLSLKEQAPKSLSFLTEKSRRYFKEILEYLEMMEIPYRINNGLIGKRFCSETIFEIKSEETVLPLAIGLRYDAVSKRLGFKKELPAVGVKLVFKTLLPEKAKKLQAVKTLKKPKFYFIQLGFDAKLKSLQVVEILRQAKISLFQSLSKDKFTAQMATAENLKIPYVIIMGQKEAMENSVIVRHMVTRSQDTIAITDLPKYLEKIK